MFRAKSKANQPTKLMLAISLFIVTSVFSTAQAENCESILIVDGYSSGRFLAPQAKALGYDVYHLHSLPTPPPGLVSSFQPKDYVKDFSAADTADDAATLVAAQKFKAIIAGSETGVILADTLSEHFKLPTNGAEGAEARTNKYLMIEKLRAAGVRAAAQLKTDSLPEMLAWARQHGRWPVVVKPIHSAGTDGVQICHSEAEVTNAFNYVIGKTNQLRRLNDSVLIQEYLKGPEFAVDAVSANGKAIFTDIWAYGRVEIPGAATVYVEDQLLPFAGPVQEKLRAYILEVHKALGIKNGPSHAEVKLTAEGPVLVEIGSRLAGAGMPRVVAEATNVNPAALTIEAFTDPEKFAARPDGYVLNKFAWTLYLHTNGGGRMSHRQLEALKALPSVSRVELVPEGTPLTRTRDLFSTLGRIEFLSEDQSEIDRAMATIRRWEAEGLFEDHSS